MLRSAKIQNVNWVEIAIRDRGAGPPAAEGQREFGGGAPNAAAIFQLIPKHNAF